MTTSPQFSEAQAFELFQLIDRPVGPFSPPNNNPHLMTDQQPNNPSFPNHPSFRQKRIAALFRLLRNEPGGFTRPFTEGRRIAGLLLEHNNDIVGHRACVVKRIFEEEFEASYLVAKASGIRERIMFYSTLKNKYKWAFLAERIDKRCFVCKMAGLGLDDDAELMALGMEF
ncbi:uncharacterized protein LY89DRAFT_753319 [Mollisia scopiformis]|uniref:Uncharacterized protein n=1 Tax=Mollisia scopiformis TaxID=149040 RepID=A0A194X287_MOLSC|nr:uncharacterized protein LY89DRAFT_753319 [Mollisia scopiformis]KUJ13947.1 hypothetical protein LY89DRAFT_753319 [Mollisia scopiformis]